MSSSATENKDSASPETLLGHWNRLVAATPAATALIEAENDRIYSRAHLDALADQWVVNVSAIPRLRGKRVAFALPNGVQWIAIFLGILRAGGVPLPIDASEPAANQIELAKAANCRFRWTGTELSELNQVRKTPAKNRGLGLIKLTSGSTGKPRPLAFTDREMIADGQQICATMQIGPDDINLAIVPFGHSYGLGNLLIPLLVQGTASLCVSAPLPHAIAQNCIRWRPTVFPAVPALLRLLTISDLPADAFGSLRTVISAGSLLAPEIAAAFYEKYHRMVHGFYGSSETGGISYDRSGEATLTGRSVGTALEGVKFYFGRGQRFRVESPAVFTRGNRRRGETGEGQHRPADRAELYENGELNLLGRAGRMMKIAGRRIDLAELEAAVRKLPGIRDAFFTAHPQRLEELAGIVSTELSLEELRTLLRRELAAWKVPKKLLVLSQFPLTSRGKTDTAALRARLTDSS